MNKLCKYFNKCGVFKRTIPIGILLMIFLSIQTTAQQVPDTSFNHKINQPAYTKRNGAKVLIDGAHNNMHSKEGGFLPFSKLLTDDGYKVVSLDDVVNNQEILSTCKILVIANPLHLDNIEDMYSPTVSAFSDNEISTIRNWVNEGGSLFLIADHMPFAGASYELAKSFGFEFLNGFARSSEGFWPPIIFSTKDSTLIYSPVVNGKNKDEKVDKVATFTGSAFLAPPNAQPVLRFTSEYSSLQPDTAWIFKPDTPSQNLDGYYQGALLNFGKGKIAVFGEAAMFTAQIVNGNVKVGFNSDYAKQNAQFTLNVIHWLDGKLD